MTGRSRIRRTHLHGASTVMDEGARAPSDAPLYQRSDAKSETYGFSLYIFASVLWVLWCIWALCPEWLLMDMGIEWFPRREWAYILVAWSLVVVLMTYLGFSALNLHNTPPLNSLDCITDDKAILYTTLPDQPLPVLSIAETGWVGSPLSDDVYDISPGLVSRALYLDGG